MPIYEYACKTCGNRFETWQKITDEPLNECPKCHAEVHRVLFPAGVVFKGSGFYSTDHRGHKSGGESAERAATKSGEAAAGATTESKSESKSESTSESTGGSTGTPAATKPAETAKAS